MRAAVLHGYGDTPRVEDWQEPDGGAVVDVLAAGLNPVDLRIASGTYYAGAPPLPYVVGREGVGRLGSEIVYFDEPVAPFGSMAERALIDPAGTVPIPHEVDPALATAFGIAGMAGWLALEWRAHLQKGETVLVLGSSGTVGEIALQGARLLGAGRVVAAARSDHAARARELGADEFVRLTGSREEMTQAFREATGGGTDVIVDPLWGEPAAAAIEAVNPHGRLVQIGQSAGAQSVMTSAAIRGRAASILGHMNFLVPREVRHAAYRRMVDHAAEGDLYVEVESVPLDQAPDAWRRQQEGPGVKLAIVPGAR